MCLWAQFPQFTLDKPILPLLQCVNIMDSRISTQDTIPLLLISPSVREMSIWLKVSGLDDDKDTVSEACARVPHLETLSLGINPWIADLSVLHCNSRLRSISLREHLTARDLEPLTRLAELEHLFVTFGGMGIRPQTLYFPSLRRLSAKGVWEESIRDFLELV